MNKMKFADKTRQSLQKNKMPRGQQGQGGGSGWKGSQIGGNTTRANRVNKTKGNFHF